MKDFFHFCNNGSSRCVILIGKFAIKIARMTSIKEYKAGVIDNKAEAYTAKNIDKNIIPKVYFSFFGILVIHERANNIKNRGIFIIDLCEACLKYKEYSDFLMIDAKPENFGMIQGRLVKVDYGKCR